VTKLGDLTVPWHSLYKHFLYVTKFIRTFFIQDKVYTGQSLYRTKFIRGQSLYGDKVYTGTKFIRGQSLYRAKFIRGQSLYKLETFFILSPMHCEVHAWMQSMGDVVHGCVLTLCWDRLGQFRRYTMGRRIAAVDHASSMPGLQPLQY
jgi:hypothetical protein